MHKGTNHKPLVDLQYCRAPCWVKKCCGSNPPAALLNLLASEEKLVPLRCLLRNMIYECFIKKSAVLKRPGCTETHTQRGNGSRSGGLVRSIKRDVG